MTSRTTQRQRVEHLLRANGRRGVHTFELRQAYISNPSQRIIELEAAGWSISHTRERLNGTAFGTRYVKVSEPEVEVGRSDSNPTPMEHAASKSAVDLGPEQTSLFEVPPEPHWKAA